MTAVPHVPPWRETVRLAGWQPGLTLLLVLIVLLVLSLAAFGWEVGRRMRAERRVARAEAAAARDRGFLQGLLTGSTDCIEALDPDGCLVSISDKGRAMLDIDDPAALVGRPFVELWPDSAREAVLAALKAAAAGASARFLADRLTRSGLAKRLDTLIMRQAGEGDAAGFLAVSRDATPLSQAEASLSEANRSLVLAEQLAHVGHWRIDLANDSVTWSDEVYRIYGRDPLSFRPALETTLQAYHVLDRPKALACLQRAVVSRENYEFTARILRPGGQIRELLTRGFCEFSGTGELQAIFGVVADITELAEAEAERRRSDQRYKWLADNVSDLIILQQADGTCLYVSPACRTMLGYAPDEYAALRPDDIVHPDDCGRLAALRRRLDATHRHDTDVHRLRRRDGIFIWVEAAFHVLDDHEGGPAPVLLVAVRDVSERQERLEDLRLAKEAADRAREEADAASQAKSEFIAAISHELRTPLNAIIGFTGLILDNPALTPQVRRHAELVRTSGAALLAVVNDVLDFSKLEAGRIALDPRPFSPRALAEDSLSIIRGGALGTALAITASVDPAIGRVLVGDEGRLRQILLNLLNNAVKFTLAGTVALDLRLEASGPAGQTIRFSVADSGIGIAKARQDQLFRRFSRIDGATGRDAGGAGLGLAICKGLVESMQGRIGVESDEGQGATFWFTVTLPHGAFEASASPAGMALPGRPAAGRLLLVEDNPVSQELGCLMLRAAGHAVDAVADGRAAVAAVAARAYDLVLMDVHMPDMDGMVATRAIRALDLPARTIPIVAMTANVLPAQIRQFQAAGMDDHIGKPLNRAELQATVDRWLRRGWAGALPPPASEAAAVRFDAAIYEELVAMLGASTVGELMARLAADLSQRFALEAGPDRARLRQDAHAAVSSAGMLGFGILSAACAEFEVAVEEARPDLDERLAAIRTERDWVLGRVAALSPADKAAAKPRKPLADDGAPSRAIEGFPAG